MPLINEHLILSDLAYISKSYWPYDAKALELYKEHLNLFPEEITDNNCFVMELNNEIIGFYVLDSNFEKEKLSFFFIHPQYIGHGYGKKLWNHLLNIVNQLKWNSINLSTDVYAYDRFYKKLGFKVIGTETNTLGDVYNLNLALN